MAVRWIGYAKARGGMSDSQIKTSDLDRGVTRVDLVGEVDIATAERLPKTIAPF